MFVCKKYLHITRNASWLLLTFSCLISETLTKETVCFVCSDLLPLDVVFRPGLSGLLQACVDLGVKYGQFEVAHTMPSPVVLRQRLRILASECRRKLSAELKGLLNTIGGSLSLQVLRANSRTCILISVIIIYWKWFDFRWTSNGRNLNRISHIFGSKQAVFKQFRTVRSHYHLALALVLK